MKEILDAAVELIKKFEGCRLKAYQDIAGIWTIGHGETLGVKEGDVWTQEQADEQLRKRAAWFLLQVYQKCPALHTLSSEKVQACVSLAYNIGIGAFGVSSVARRTSRREFAEAADAFLLWNKARGKVVRGLTLRRQIERLLYLQQ